MVLSIGSCIRNSRTVSAWRVKMERAANSSFSCLLFSLPREYVGRRRQIVAATVRLHRTRVFCYRTNIRPGANACHGTNIRRDGNVLTVGKSVFVGLAISRKAPRQSFRKERQFFIPSTHDCVSFWRFTSHYHSSLTRLFLCLFHHPDGLFLGRFFQRRDGSFQKRLVDSLSTAAVDTGVFTFVAPELSIVKGRVRIARYFVCVSRERRQACEVRG